MILSPEGQTSGDFIVGQEILYLKNDLKFEFDIWPHCTKFIWPHCGKSAGIFEINLHSYQFLSSSERDSAIINYFLICYINQKKF